MSLERGFDVTEVRQVAQELLGSFPEARKFAFSGDVGAGKTTLIKALAHTLGFTDDVDSPTFSLVNEYKSLGVHIIHIDLYRISGNEIDSIGLDAYFQHQDAYFFVEWPEKVPQVITEDFVIVQLSLMGEGRKMLARSIS